MDQSNKPFLESDQIPDINKTTLQITSTKNKKNKKKVSL
jgi:hypothetical protein